MSSALLTCVYRVASNCGTGAERSRNEPMQQTTHKTAYSANSGLILVAYVVYCDNTIRNMMNPGKRYTCSEGGESYSYNKTLKTHVSQFNHERNVMCHDRKECGLENSFMKVKCPLCDISVLSKKNYCDHLSMKRAVSIAPEETDFASFQEFCEWKKQTERKTLSLYVKKCGSYRTSDNVTRHSFVCYRSGQYVSKSKGIRRMKIQGINKIGGVCPSSIEVTEAGDGSCKVKYVVTHVGHQNGVRHLDLTEEERNKLAVDMANKVPLQAILDKVVDTLSDSMLEHIYLLTEKYLYKIEQCNNLRSEVMRQKDDGISVETWVNEINASDNPCVLFYKLQDTSSQSHPLLSSQDIVLIIMNNAPCEILKKHGSDCISIDGTHGTNGYSFELITLLVLDDLRQGFPCAFRISNRSDQDVLSLFLIK
ncbi:uncharacterized protein LOC126153889 [Schistocerca cancellata]|uniref:uncharacterized protein LOC126153889 n=1 Tax=Schistocerca cancellata TaxID=274614 RepID=UPI002118DD12|nr:uncharacterized protein LOC126153889 [Schistocerca cancellata]